MQVKVYCPCGAKFAFDVEPARGRMPVPIQCPTCGQDATELADQEIARQLGGGSSSTATQARAVATSPAHPAPVAQILSGTTAAAATAPQAAARTTSPTEPARPSEAHGEICPRHVGRRVVESCRVCGKPICRKCMAMFGYVCSPFCRSKAEAEGIQLPVYAQQRSEVDRRAKNRTRLILVAAASTIVLLIAATGYYKLYATKPHIIHAQPLPGSEFDMGICKILDTAYLTLAGGQLSLYNLDNGKPIWSVSTGEDGDGSGSELWDNATVLDHQQDIWILSGNRVVCYELATGARKHQVTLEGYVTDQHTDANAITLVSLTGGGFGGSQRQITQIAFAEGQVTTHEVAAAAEADQSSSSFVLTGPNIAELQVTLLERRQIVREAIKTPSQSILDSGQVSGANSLQAVEELANEISRTQTGGKEYEDASRYQVRLRRHMETNAPEWSDEVVGHVEFFPMETVDVLVAGKTLRAFDKQNNLKWQANLTFGIDDSFESVFGGIEPPALEVGNTLYFFDKGMLTAFDLGTGTPRWRVTSVGIRRIQDDVHGDLYVSTTSANAEDIQYSQQIKVLDKTKPVFMKVDAATGEVLWQTTMAGDHCILTGDFVYSTNAKIDFTAMLNPENETVHFRVFRINPKTGARLWTYYQPQQPVAMDFHENMLLLQYTNEVQLLKYAAF